MPYLDRDGLRLYYDIEGPTGASTGTKPPLLLSHGYSASGEMWAVNRPALTAEHRLITWDIRGHGRTDSPTDPTRYSEELSVADMAAVLDAARVERAVIGGLSLGGYLSLAFHIRHPERVIALILCDTGPGYRRDGPRAEWNEQALRRAADYEARGIEAMSSSAEVRASGPQNPVGLAMAARGILTQRDSQVIDSLPDIDVPTLVLVGAKDEPFLGAADMMAAKIPGATKVVLEGAGHGANIDQPEAFDRAVLDFLDHL